jgi:methylated-DNA-protein-cysteine methyltransferase-like protein
LRTKPSAKAPPKPRPKSATIWKRVHALVKRIPRGRVVTYGGLAKILRLPGGARAAGWAMGACPSGHGVPWHRVVGAGGHILLQEPRAALQRRLLESEGTQLLGNSVNLELHLWSRAKPPKNRPKRRMRAKVFR